MTFPSLQVDSHKTPVSTETMKGRRPSMPSQRIMARNSHSHPFKFSAVPDGRNVGHVYSACPTSSETSNPGVRLRRRAMHGRFGHLTYL